MFNPLQHLSWHQRQKWTKWSGSICFSISFVICQFIHPLWFYAAVGLVSVWVCPSAFDKWWHAEGAHLRMEKSTGGVKAAALESQQHRSQCRRLYHNPLEKSSRTEGIGPLLSCHDASFIGQLADSMQKRQRQAGDMSFQILSAESCKYYTT